MPYIYPVEGDEFRVNTYTDNSQLLPDITGLADGGYVVVWHSWYQDGSQLGAYAQVFNADGTPRGSEVQISAHTAGHQAYPDVAALPDGGYIITWESDDYNVADGIYAQIYNADGSARGGQIAVEESNFGQYEPAVAVASDGSFAITWMFGPGGDSWAQVFNADGTKRGAQFVVNTTSQDSIFPQIAALAGGGYVITWESWPSDNDDGSGAGVFAQAFNADGTRHGSEFRVNTYTTGDQSDPQITALADGGYVICWDSSGQDGSGYGVYAQAYNSNGTPRGSEFQVNSTTDLDQLLPSITSLATGDFVISWSSSGQDGSGSGVYAQIYRPDGTPWGVEFQINSYTTDNQTHPAIAGLAGGGFVAGWASYGQDGSYDGVYAQRFWPILLPTTGPDIINGSSGDDIINGLNGDDTVNGRGGNDSIDGGPGIDRLTGGGGDDTYHFGAGSGADTITDLSAGDRVLVSDYLSYDSITQSGSDVVVVFGPGDQITFLNTTVDAVEGAFTRPSGTDGPDHLLGTSGSDTISGFDGNDYINGRGGEDTILGGFGNDTLYGDDLTGLDWANNTLYGNEGDDTIYGGYGTDTIYGGAGDDTIYGDGHYTSQASDSYAAHSVNDYIYADDGNDTIYGSGLIYGGAGDDHVYGDDGDDFIEGGTGNDIIYGGGGDDYYLDGGAGNDQIYGGEGDDFIDSYSGDDTIDGGDGIDTLSFASQGFGVTFSLAVTGPQSAAPFFGFDTVTGIENLEGSAGNDQLTGDSQSNELVGLEGNDVLDGGAGDDTLTGGAGADTMTGGTGDDTYYVDTGADTVIENAGEGIDRVYSTVSYILGANTELLALLGSSAINATGNALANTLVGNSAANVLDGRGGADSMSGGAGDDTYVVNNSGDTVSENAGEGRDRVYSAISYTLGANVEILALTGSYSVNATGNALNNTIVGNSGVNILDGGAGADSMSGGLGNDTYYVDNTGDVVVENADAGRDRVYSSVSYGLRPNIEILALLGDSAINGIGNDIANTLIGNSAANVLDGRGGADSMSGGLGDDTYYVDNVGDTVIENASAGRDRVYSSINYTLADNVEILALLGTSAINATGNGLANTIIGNSGANVIIGGGGADVLMGGLGGDTFVFRDGDFTNPGGSAIDRILDFNHSQGDQINLAGVDANGGTAGDQAFAFIGTSAFHHTAGELRYEIVNGNTFVSGDANGDGLADFLIRLDGSHALVSGDFVL